jgi:hypothetical protein
MTERTEMTEQKRKKIWKEQKLSQITAHCSGVGFGSG